MDNNPTETTGQTKEREQEDSGIVIESVQDDMRSYGIDVVQESMDEEEEDTPETSTDTPKEDGQEKPKKKSRAQRKIERQARELKEKEEEIKRLKEWRESNQDEDPGQEEDHEEIDIDDFETYEEYKAAVDRAKEVAKTKAPATEKDIDNEAPKGITKELSKRIADMTEDGQEDYSNFDEVVRNPELPLTVQVLDAITSSEQAADIAYYLGTHLDRAKKLAQMDKRAMDKEILRIEIELEKKPNKVVRTTKAPDPINPVRGGSSAEGKTLDDNDLTYEQHEALLNQGRKAAKGGFL